MFYACLPGGARVALAQLPGGTLDPASIPKFRSALRIPPVMPQAGTVRLPAGGQADYYEISVRQFRQQVLPAGMPSTTVWGYGPLRSQDEKGVRDPPRALRDDRGEARPAGPGEVGQRARRRPRALPSTPSSRRPDPALGEPARRRSRPGLTPDAPEDAGRVHRPRADGAAPARRCGGGRRERRLPRGVVPARRRRTSPRAMPTTAPGTPSSPASRRPATARPGVPDSRCSSTRTATERRRSGSMTTASGCRGSTRMPAPPASTSSAVGRTATGRCGTAGPAAPRCSRARGR